MEHITPAILKDKEEREISSEELQKTLHSWFKDKGLLKNLRCHLRLQMIEILRNTAVGKNLVKQPFKTATLAQQAINLIIAEYLIRNNCHYSLSMFTTEVSLNGVLPQCLFDSSNMYQNWQFTQENLINILELNGVSKHSQQCEQILSLYYSCGGNTSLLNALIRALCDISNNAFNPISVANQEIPESTIDIPNLPLAKLLRNTLQQTQLSPKIITHIVTLTKKHHELELSRKDDEFSNVFKSLQENLYEKDTKIAEISKLNDTLKSKIIKKINENKELKLDINKLFENEKGLKSELKRVLRTLHVQKMEKVTQTDPIIIEVTKNDDCILSHCNDMCKDALNVIEYLKLENNKLSVESAEQRMELLSLTSKCNQLLDDYNTAQTKLTYLTSKINKKNDLINKETSPLPSNKTSASDIFVDERLETYSSCDSITQDILLRAKQKLKQLEMESNEIDTRFNKYINLAKT
ncbi:unnamed protein product [Brassicogethes aeneus]|uniref:LisH domain-containing protein n=1 Tax=Brassicogethes aeneus TaxID=1431903 RepID=A0A9P0BCN4_BRAAE|nr:unnamed protein product [Brassicogethes aeneus]